MTTTAEQLGYGRVRTGLPPHLRDRDLSPRPLATFLGLFSLGLGLAEAVAPGRMSRLTGVPHRGLIRGYGMREMTSGVGILTSDRPAPWLWSRVAGDALDLATLAAAYAEARREDRTRILAAAGAVVGVTALDVLCACEHSGNHSGQHH
jgi:hypothetical protein